MWCVWLYCSWKFIHKAGAEHPHLTVPVGRCCAHRTRKTEHLSPRFYSWHPVQAVSVSSSSPVSLPPPPPTLRSWWVTVVPGNIPSILVIEQKHGGGIVYYPPENLAEYLDSSLVTPVTGGISPAPTSGRSSRRGSGCRRVRCFFDEVRKYLETCCEMRDAQENAVNRLEYSPRFLVTLLQYL